MTTKEEGQQKQEQKQPKKAFGPGIPRQTPVIYHVTTGSLSEVTKNAYERHINDFLAKLQITDVTPLREYSPKHIRQMVLDYVLELRDVRKISRSSIKVHCAALSHFFYMIRDDDTRLDWTKVKMEFPPNENVRRDRAYTTEEIQKLLSVCSRRRDKAIILLLESTGMRIGGIHTPKMRDLTPKTTPQGKVYQIEVYSNSSASYFCYCNVETAKAVDEYLKERTDKGEILQNDMPLIRDLRTLNVKNVKPLSSYSIKYIVSEIVEKSGIKNTFQFTGEAKRSKGLRKYYKTTAERSGMKSINVEITHGHSIGVSERYYTPSESEVLEDYLIHAADALTVDPTQRLEQENQDLKTVQAEQLNKQAQQIAELMAEVRNFQRETRWTKELAKKLGYSDSKLCEINNGNFNDLKKEGKLAYLPVVDDD